MTEETPEMSPKTRDIIIRVRAIVPPLLPKFHKGILLIYDLNFNMAIH